MAIHVLRQWCLRNENCSDKIPLKLDFKNAFNCISREVFFKEVDEFMPGLSRWVQWCYGVSSHLVFGTHLVESQSGAQQGDP